MTVPADVPDQDRSGGTTADLSERLRALEQQLADLRELVVRAHEATPRAATELLRARREPSYEDAFGSEPLVTVRIGAYQPGDTLFERALTSVRRQSYERWEAVVVCDGRDAETRRRICALRDERIRCYERPRNGPYPQEARRRWQVAGAHPFNEGFAAARGAWVAPIDQDDEWLDDHLEALLGAALDGRAEVTYGVGRVLVADAGETYFGAWPPELGDFGFQTAIHHAGLTAFLYDANAHLLDEPADWNLARRMLEAGVRFDFLGRVVTNYFVPADAPGIGFWRDRVRERGAFAPGG